MINERTEVMQYLQGKNLHRDIEYRICLLLAKWYYEQGCNTVEAIREQLKNWAKENKFYFEVAMNPIATHVIEDDMKLQGDIEVFISSSDVEEITKRFDTYYERIVALGILCYAKAYADAKGEFKLSQRSMCRWLDINKGTMSRYLEVMEDLNYISKVEVGETKSWYQKTVVTSLNKYRILVPIENHGEYQLNENDIQSLYAKLFLSIDTDQEKWFDVPGYHGWYQVSDCKRVRVREHTVSNRSYPSRILKLFASKSGKFYANLIGNDNKQKKISVDALINLALDKQP